jgi:tRNA (mo5U34)-methyltransferase
MNREALRQRVAAHRWFHRIDLGDGLITPGIDDSAGKLARLRLPASLAGLTVLDVGAWDGYFSFAAERRGAARVLAVDSYCWSGAGWGNKTGFNLAREALGSRVEDAEIEVLDLDPARIGVFDVVLFLGVLYHMRHPLLALEKVAAVTKGHLILETKVDLLRVRTPAAAFYPEKEMNNDPTNWWGPNPAAMVAMLRTVGFGRVEIVDAPRPWWSRLAVALGRGREAWRQIPRSRLVVHAWK